MLIFLWNNNDIYLLIIIYKKIRVISKICIVRLGARVFFFLRSIINQLHLKYYFHETTFKNILVILL
jgi:hypothetical protein